MHYRMSIIWCGLLQNNILRVHDIQSRASEHRLDFEPMWNVVIRFEAYEKLQVVSKNFYADGLQAAPRNAGNRLILSPSGLLQVDTGAEFISVPHEGNLQSSEAGWLGPTTFLMVFFWFEPQWMSWYLLAWQEEAEVVHGIVEQLLLSQVVLDNEPPRAMKPADIIIVCPYNAQVVMIRRLFKLFHSRLRPGKKPQNMDDMDWTCILFCSALWRSMLAKSQTRAMRDIRVGSVDLFQGQQAAVSIISLGSSSGAGGRMLFVLDPKRTNVAFLGCTDFDSFKNVWVLFGHRSPFLLAGSSSEAVTSKSSFRHAWQPSVRMLPRWDGGRGHHTESLCEVDGGRFRIERGATSGIKCHRVSHLESALNSKYMALSWGESLKGYVSSTFHTDNALTMSVGKLHSQASWCQRNPMPT